jgi:biopolymer transport protein ExbD
VLSIKREKKSPKITTSSMSDIGFLLLIFIMLLSLINQKYEAKIEYGEAVNIEKTDLAHNLEIWIKKNGRITSGGKEYSIPDLEQLIAQSVVEHPDVRIQIIADKETPYMYVNDVVEILQLLQHRVVGFVVREKKGE